MAAAFGSQESLRALSPWCESCDCSCSAKVAVQGWSSSGRGAAGATVESERGVWWCQGTFHWPVLPENPLFNANCTLAILEAVGTPKVMNPSPVSPDATVTLAGNEGPAVVSSYV